MQLKSVKPFLFLVGFVLAVGLACSLATPEEAPPAPPSAPDNDAEASAPPTEPPTSVPAPTATPVPEPTSPPPTPAPQRFFTEEFDGNFDGWLYFYFADDESGFDVAPQDGRLVFDIQDEYNWVYVYYDAQTYDDVRIEVEANNRGYNNNNVSLICRYSDAGWYEFNIANNGLYWIYLYDENSDAGFKELANGGSNKIHSGKETNQYAAVCNGKKLTLYINGVKTRTIEDGTLDEGKVGVSVSSFDVVPINVEIEWFKIMAP